MRVPALLSAALAIVCAGADANGQGQPVDTIALSPNAIIFDGGQIPAMLRQCSRSTPAAGEGSWHPSPSHIAALETALPAALAAYGQHGADFARAPEGWYRQYVGIVRGGRRLIYGNFLPSWIVEYDAAGGRWRREPVGVCDGGPGFFGAEYDVEAGRFTDFAFNGFA